MGDIHRQRQGRIAGFFHAADDVLRPLLVPMHIELEDLRCRGRGGGVL
jgi:hypothetical protein